MPLKSLNFQITLRRPNADKVKQCFAEISDRFCEMLLHPLIVYTQKELLNHNHKDLVTVQLKSVNPAKTQTSMLTCLSSAELFTRVKIQIKFRPVC